MTVLLSGCAGVTDPLFSPLTGSPRVVLPENVNTLAVVSNDEIAASDAANIARTKNFRTFRPSDLRKYLGNVSKLRQMAHTQGADAILIVETERPTSKRMKSQPVKFLPKELQGNSSSYTQYQVPGSARLINSRTGITYWSSSVGVGFGNSKVWATKNFVSSAMSSFPANP